MPEWDVCMCEKICIIMSLGEVKDNDIKVISGSASYVNCKDVILHFLLFHVFGVPQIVKLAGQINATENRFCVFSLFLSFIHLETNLTPMLNPKVSLASSYICFGKVSLTWLTRLCFTVLVLSSLSVFMIVVQVISFQCSLVIVYKLCWSWIFFLASAEIVYWCNTVA